MVNVGWFGPIYEIAGYSEVARNLIPELKKLGVNFYIKPDVWGTATIRRPELNPLIKLPTRDMIHIYHKIGMGFHTSGRYNIGYTVFETTRLHKLWVPKMNQMDEIWTPSTFCKKTFQSSGVRKPIYVIHHGVDVNRFNPNVKPVQIHNKRKFCFLAVFSGTLERKGLDTLIGAFTEEFKKREDVCLVIKAHTPLKDIRRKLNQMLDYERESAPIIWIGTPITWENMPRLYQAADCFISPSRGEGWDLTCTEAMASGIPVIASAWGGHLDYLNESNSFLIKIYKLVPVNVTHIQWYSRTMKWAEPSRGHLRQLMRYVFEHPQKAKEKAIKARKDVVKKLQWSHAALKAYDRLKRV